MAFNDLEVVAVIPSGDPEKEIRVRVVEVTQFKGAPRLTLDIREFLNTPTYNGPTKKGVMFLGEEVQPVIDAMEEGLRLLKAHEAARSNPMNTGRPPAKKAAAKKKPAKRTSAPARRAS